MVAGLFKFCRRRLTQAHALRPRLHRGMPAPGPGGPAAAATRAPGRPAGEPALTGHQWNRVLSRCSAKSPAWTMSGAALDGSHVNITESRWPWPVSKSTWRCRVGRTSATHISRETMTTFDVRLGGHECGIRGNLKLGNDGLTWTSQNGDRKLSINKNDADSAEWFRTGPKHFQFRVRQSDQSQHRCQIERCSHIMSIR